MSEALALFCEALERADADELCSPPGLGGLWRVRHIRSGLGRRVLVEYDGIIAFARNAKHGLCENCAAHAKRGGRAECTHCACTTCVWEREADEHGGPRATKAQVDALRAKMRAFEIGGRLAPVASLVDDL